MSQQPYSGEPYDPRYPTTNPDEDYDPRYPTVDSDEEPMDADQPATASLADQYGELDPSSDRVQGFGDGQYLWHSSMPSCYVAVGTTEFVDMQQGPTGRHLLQADRFTRTPLDYGDDFYLLPDGDGVYDVGAFTTDPNVAALAPGAVYVPWHHVMQHSYAHMDEFDIKEVHTFWPVGTTEEDVLEALVGDLNDNGGNGIVWESDSSVKTFFPSNPATPGDRYSAGQMSDLCDLLRD